MVRKPQPVVSDGKHHLLSSSRCRNPDHAALDLRLQTMLDGVLNNRLQQHRRQRRTLQVVRKMQFKLQPVSHTNLEQFEVVSQQVELLLHGARLRAARGQTLSQIGDEIVHHQIRFVRRATDQALNRGQRVEQKMRLDLRLQHAHLRLHQLLFARHDFELFARHDFVDLALLPFAAKKRATREHRQAVNGQAESPAERGPMRPNLAAHEQVDGPQRRNDDRVHRRRHVPTAHFLDALLGAAQRFFLAHGLDRDQTLVRDHFAARLTRLDRFALADLAA